jgi:DNA primase
MTQTLPRDIVSRIKEETDIAGVVRQYVTLTVSGSSLKGLCPFHRERTPSFNVNPNLQIYKCFGCGEGGDVISFLMKIEGLSFLEALETLARPLDIDLSRYLREDESEGERVAFHRANEAASQAWQECLAGAQGESARRYLSRRGFGGEILQRYEVGYAPPGGEWLEIALQRRGVARELALASNLLRRNQNGVFAYFRGRIIFPIKNIAQRVAGFGGRILREGEPKYLNSPDSTYFSKGKLLYGFAASRIAIARLKTAILVEGYLDLLALAQHGFSNCVATCGTAFTPEQASVLRRGGRSVIILFDGDRAGLQATVKACHVAMAAGLEPKVARPETGEDPASQLQAQGRDAMAACLAGARDYLPFLHDLVQARGNGRRDRERGLRQALRSIGLVQDPIRQEYLLQEAAELFGMRLELLRQQIAGEQQSRSRRARVPGGAPGDAAGSVDASPTSRAAHPAAGEDRFGPRGPDGRRSGGIRSFGLLDRPAVEATLLAHVLRDASGKAALAYCRQQEEDPEPAARPEALRLQAELAAWYAAYRTDEEPRSPARFVQERWHEQDQEYRSYVSELLAKEVVPESTDFVRVVHDCLERLRGDRRRREASGRRRTA